MARSCRSLGLAAAALGGLGASLPRRRLALRWRLAGPRLSSRRTVRRWSSRRRRGAAYLAGRLPRPAGGRGLMGCRRGAPFAAAARARARRAASWDIGGRGGCGALGLGAVDLAARRVSWTARLMMTFYRSVMAGVERCGHSCVG